MKITIDKADAVFSQFIRLRDKRCRRCGSWVRFNEKGLPVSHTNSHYYTRGKETTRFEPNNCDTLCFPCHRLWGGDHRADYTAFKKKQLGEDAFKRMDVQAHMSVSGFKDRAMSYIIAKKLLERELKK